ncbi:MAG: acyl-CoA thioesterase [Alcanivorax sp.]|jgi:acyl-CoA thioesterase
MDAQQLAQACAISLYKNDRACKSLGIELTHVSPGSAEMSMSVRPEMLNGHDVCHGGFIFSLADTAFAYACNSQNLNTVASGARIEFLAPGRDGDVLTARAEVKAQGGRTGLYDVSVTNQDNKQIALFRGNAHRIGGTLVDDGESS